MTGVPADLELARGRVERTRLVRPEGVVQRVVGLAVESEGPPCSIGEDCLLLDAAGQVLSRAQVVGFAGSRVFSMPVERLHGIAVGSRVLALGRRATLGVGQGLLGRVLDADGAPLDGGAPPIAEAYYELEGPAPAALERQRIHEPFVTGVRSIDGLLTLGRGQRVGIFAGSGVGKSMLLGMIARHARRRRHRDRARRRARPRGARFHRGGAGRRGLGHVGRCSWPRRTNRRCGASRPRRPRPPPPSTSAIRAATCCC